MKVNIRTILTAALLVAPAAWGQTQPRPAGAQPSDAPTTGKVAVLDVRTVIANSAEGRMAQAELQSQFAPRENELQNIKKQIDDGRVKLEARTGTEEERASLARRLDLLQKKGQRLQEEGQEELQAANSDVFDRIGRKLTAVIDRYARENGYAIVLEESSLQSLLL